MDFSTPQGLSIAAEEGSKSEVREKPTFGQLYAARFHDVCRWTRAFGGLDADVDDLAQEVFMVVRRKLDSFDGCNLNGWLYRIAQLTVRDYRRRAWFRRRFSSKREDCQDDAMDTLADTGLAPDEVLARRQAERHVAGLLRHMSETRRTAFILFEIEGYSGEEIAALEGVPVNTIWTRLHHARKQFTELVDAARKEGRL
jgi:RNA polymerase sigma-70 factor, ECF subfamily